MDPSSELEVLGKRMAMQLEYPGLKSLNADTRSGIKKEFQTIGAVGLKRVDPLN